MLSTCELPFVVVLDGFTATERKTLQDMRGLVDCRLSVSLVCLIAT